jgi:hypothetical protein
MMMAAYAETCSDNKEKMRILTDTAHGKKVECKSELCLIVTEETLEGERDIKKNELNFLTISVKRIFQF